MNLWYRFCIYILPLPMWLFEYFMRTIMNNPEANDFFPSSIAAASLGLIIPVLAPKPVQQVGLAIPPGTLLVNQKDEHVRRTGMMALFLGTPLWLLTVYLSIGGHWPPHWILTSIDQKFWIGVILYIIAFGLNEWKERV